MINERRYSADVVITAGGTRELIDDVRFIGNLPTGKLGYELAKAYSQLGYSVLLLAPKFVIDLYGKLENIEHIPFFSALDLERELLNVESAKLVIHSAAVSDYTPIRVYGKISSDEDEITITLKRNPKIIANLRDHFGAKTTIVGFKLLSGVPETKLISIAKNQISANNTDICVANDFQELKETRRIHIVQKDGSYETLVETAESLAIKLSQALPVEGVMPRHAQPYQLKPVSF